MEVEINISKEEIFEFLKNRVEAQGFKALDIYENVELDYEECDFVGVTLKVKIDLDKDKILAN